MGATKNLDLFGLCAVAFGFSEVRWDILGFKLSRKTKWHVHQNLLVLFFSQFSVLLLELPSESLLARTNF